MDHKPLEALFVQQTARFRRAPNYRASVYAAIKKAILAGELAPNQPLIEEQLAASLNISRTPVREALAILQHERLIGPNGSRGLYVRSLTRAEFVDMFVANEVIEPFLARRAALNASDEQIALIGAAVAQAEEALARQHMAGFLQASRDFHRRLGNAAGNAILTDFVLNNEERADMYLLHSGKVIDPANMALSVREHGSIYGALLQRDSESAERLVIYHAQSLRARLADLFSPPSEENPHP